MPDYCAALANEGGGKLILGVDDEKSVVGTTVYSGTENKIPHQIYSKLKIRVEMESINYKGQRVLIFSVPSRLPGQPIKSTGHYTYPMRVGESLTEMDSGTLRSILNETEPDFSSTTVDDLHLNDLDKEALKRFKALWSAKANRPDFLKVWVLQTSCHRP